MEFKQLKSYVAVVKYGSFTKAAEKLFVSQPTISAHISSLEEELNKKLIIRTTKSIEITEKGMEVYEYAIRILELKDRMMEACEEKGQHIIYLGASTIPSAYILPEVLPKFGKLHPDIYFVIHQSDSQGVVDGLLDGVFDIGLIGMKEEEKLICKPFCKDRIVLITPVTEQFLKMQKEKTIPLTELLKEPIILREEGSASGKSASRFLESIGMTEDKLNVTARINDQETIKNLVASGLGISFISEKAVRNFVEEKRLLQFELPVQNERELYVVYRKDEDLKSSVREFDEFIRKGIQWEKK